MLVFCRCSQSTGGRPVWLLAVLSVCLFAWSSAWSSAKVRDYRVEIDAPIGLKAILEKNLDLVRWRGNERLDDDQIERLFLAVPGQIKTLVATEGYFAAQVVSNLDQSGEEWQIRLQVIEGEPTRVAQIDLQFQGFNPLTAPSPEDLRAAWPLLPGKIFRQTEWEQAKRGLLRQALTLRYPGAQLLETQADVNLDTQQVNLKVVLQSGPEVLFGEADFEGLQRYGLREVAHLNTIKPGDVYSETALLELQARLQDSRYFTAVAVSAELNLTEDVEKIPSTNITPVQVPVRVPVRIALTEQRLKKVDLGLGYSTNTGNRLQATYTNLNWLGAQVDSALTLETRKQSARVDFQLPVGMKSYADTVSVALERADINSEVTRIATLAYKRSWSTRTSTRSVTLEYQNEQKTIDGFPKVISQTLPFTYQFTRRDFDQLLFPTRGHALTFQVGGTPVRLLSDEPFVRGSVKYLQYWTLNKQVRLVARAELGGLASRDKDGVPSSFLFRAGGDSSVRGYGFAELGERVGDAIVGARYLGTASVEGQYWVNEKWGVAAFYDAGNAQDNLKAFRPKSGYGVGGRWKSLVGPINLDLAYGHAVRKFRLHFSLGLLF